jgi:hypothetical protein
MSSDEENDQQWSPGDSLRDKLLQLGRLLNNPSDEALIQQFELVESIKQSLPKSKSDAQLELQNVIETLVADAINNGLHPDDQYYIILVQSMVADIIEGLLVKPNKPPNIKIGILMLGEYINTTPSAEDLAEMREYLLGDFERQGQDVDTELEIIAATLDPTAGEPYFHLKLAKGYLKEKKQVSEVPEDPSSEMFRNLINILSKTTVPKVQKHLTKQILLLCKMKPVEWKNTQFDQITRTQYDDIRVMNTIVAIWEQIQ